MAKRKTATIPPKHGGDETKVRLSVDLHESLYIGGIWYSPGEEAYVAADEASKLVKAGKAEEVAAD